MSKLKFISSGIGEKKEKIDFFVAIELFLCGSTITDFFNTAHGVQEKHIKLEYFFNISECLDLNELKKAKEIELKSFGRIKIKNIEIQIQLQAVKLFIEGIIR